MLSKTAYMDLMKGCSKWNSRLDEERRRRYPVFDAQTATAHRPFDGKVRRVEDRHESRDASGQLYKYESIEWQRRSDAPPTDAIELRYFFHVNPAIKVAADASHVQPTAGGDAGGTAPPVLEPHDASAEVSMMSEASTAPAAVERNAGAPEPRTTTSTRRSAAAKRDFYEDDDLDEIDDFEEPEPPSDDEEYTSRKKKRTRGGAGAGLNVPVPNTKKKNPRASQSSKQSSGAQSTPQSRRLNASAAPAVDAATPAGKQSSSSSSGAGAGAAAGNSGANDTSPNEESPKPYGCKQCGARYRSRPGLAYHRAHVHADSANSAQQSQSAAAQAPPQPPQQPPAQQLAAAARKLVEPGVDISDVCDLCQGGDAENKKTGQPEALVSCHDCGRSAHPTCLNFTSNMHVSTAKYGWQCIECKSCAICGKSDNDDQLLFCDDCDRGFHLYCLRPPLQSPPENQWSCYLCQQHFGQSASLPAGR